MKNISRQTFVISIILLLVGVSISSAISVDTESTISNKESEKCKSCGEVSKIDLIRVERLLDRVEVYSKLLFVLSRHNPELTEVSERSSFEISILKEGLIDDGFPIICDLIWTIVGPPLNLIAEIVFYIDDLLGGEGIFALLVGLIVSPLLIPIIEIGERLDCWWANPY
jgi:hypothetical protein